jgi:hypothetical protein
VAIALWPPAESIYQRAAFGSPPFIWIGLGLRKEAAAGRAQAVAGDEACSAAPLLLLCREVDDLRSDLDTVFRQELVSGSCNFPGIEIPDVL